MSAHTLKVGRRGSPRQPALKVEHVDAYTARNLRWTYRYLRTCGVSRNEAHMIVHSAYSSGVVTGHAAGLNCKRGAA